MNYFHFTNDGLWRLPTNHLRKYRYEAYLLYKKKTLPLWTASVRHENEPRTKTTSLFFYLNFAGVL